MFQINPKRINTNSFKHDNFSEKYIQQCYEKNATRILSISYAQLETTFNSNGYNIRKIARKDNFLYFSDFQTIIYKLDLMH